MFESFFTVDQISAVAVFFGVFFVGSIFGFFAGRNTKPAAGE